MLKIKSDRSTELLKMNNLLLKENDLGCLQDSLSKMFEAYHTITTDNQSERQTVDDKYTVLQEYLVFLDALADTVPEVN